MPSRHLLDPDLAMLTEWGADVDFMALREMMPPPEPPPPSQTVDWREVRLPGPPGAPEVRALLYTPKGRAEQRPAVLHIHGGGYVLGSPDMGAVGHIALAEAFGAVVLSVDYRLAPETRFPGAVEDCYAALRWLHEEADALGIDRSRIIVSGESAGGGLAAGLALLARDRGEYPLAFQHLVFPMIDDRTVTRGHPSPFIGQYVWTRPHNAFGWAALLGCEPGSEGVSCYAAAARAEDLAGLPPTFIVCGALDLFVEENIDYAKRLILAGVPTELHIFPGAPHGYPMSPEAFATQATTQASMTAIGRALARG